MSSIDPRRGRGVPSGAGRVQAVREGRAIRKFVSHAVPGAGVSVLTQPTIVFNLSPGRRVLVQDSHFGVTTLNDECHFEIGWTDQPDGAGTFTPFSAHRHVFTGAANVGYLDYDDELRPPSCASYAAGARSVTYRVDANDANCEITCEWAGWWEQE